MRNHKKWIKQSLAHKFSRDDEGEEIVKQLLQQHPTPTEYDNGPHGNTLKRKHYLECVDKINNEYTPDLCGQIHAYGGGTLKGYNRQRNIMAKRWDADREEWEPRLIDVGDGEAGVPMPCLKEKRTVMRARDRACQVSGIRHLNEDGSAVVAWTYLEVIRRSIISKGTRWIKARGCRVKALVAGDAVQCNGKWTHITARVMGVFRDANSPFALWGMAHYLGGDDWEPLQEQCQGIFDAMRSLQQNGNKITITFPATATAAAEDVEVTVRQLLCADGAMLDAEEGGSGFTGDHSCVICQVAKSDLLNEKKKNAKYTTAIPQQPLPLTRTLAMQRGGLCSLFVLYVQKKIQLHQGLHQ